MKTRFTPNIDGKGRLARALVAVALFAGAWWALTVSVWFTAGLLAAGVFVAFEALRGWCAARACGIKTRL